MTELSPPPAFFEGAQQLGVHLQSPQLDILTQFVGLLLDANARMNLTTISAPEQVWMRHVLDSLSLVPYLNLPKRSRVIDVGSGGGMPGIVLSIVCPTLRFSLVDSVGKKVKFLQQCATSLGLDNVTPLHARAEDLAGIRSKHREHYATAVARALAPLPVLLELVIPFLNIGGQFLAIKGERAEAELKSATNALTSLNAVLEQQQRTSTGTILRFKKTAKTPPRYPRKPGDPKRNPL